MRVATAEEPMVKSTKTSDERLAEFRNLLAKADKGKGVDAYIIPTEDPHMVQQFQSRLAYLPSSLKLCILLQTSSS